MELVAIAGVGALGFWVLSQTGAGAKAIPIGETTDNLYGLRTAKAATPVLPPKPAERENGGNWETFPVGIHPTKEDITPSREVLDRMERCPNFAPPNFEGHAERREATSRLWTSGRWHGRYAPAVSGLQ